MKTLAEKIFITVLLVMTLVGVFWLVAAFLKAVIIMDDDLIFLYGMALSVANSSSFLFLILSSLIGSIWQKKKTKKQKQGEEK